MEIRVSFCSVLLSLFVTTALFAQNQPPSAEPQTVFTQERVEIILRGSDPEGSDLKFTILEPPRYGDLSEPEPIVPEPETDPRTGEPIQPPITSARVIYSPGELVPDQFTFSVTDDQGASGMAVVSINPGGEPPPPPVEQVDAHDTEATVYLDTLTTLTMTGAAPEGVSLTFELLSKPRYGEISELVQGSEEPRRSASITYLPQRGYLGEDAFDFQACSEKECDRAVVRINVIERPVEEPRLVADIKVKLSSDQPAVIALDQNFTPAPLPGKPIVLRALVAGNVADEDRDGRGDSVNENELIKAGVNLDEGAGATGTARMQFEWDLRPLFELNPTIAGANVRMQTHRSREEGLVTMFHALATEGDGKLTPDDFESLGERVKGGVMPMPSLDEMPVGEVGTFTFDAIGELRNALAQKHHVLALQGRAANEKQKERLSGLDVFTGERAPELIVETSVDPKALVYSILSLPETGTLKDSLGREIREVPYTLPDALLTYVPEPKVKGTFSVYFQGTNGFVIDIARLDITLLFGNCAEDAKHCNNGR